MLLDAEAAHHERQERPRECEAEARETVREWRYGDVAAPVGEPALFVFGFYGDIVSVISP
jgi:hypothetical protein